MRKLVIVLTIIAFMACFGIGLYLAEIVPGTGILKGDSGKVQLSTPASRSQHNILVIRVDDLQSKSPQLVSIWGLIVYYPEPKLIFQRVYPLGMVDQNQIKGSFSLSARKIPSQSFLKILNEKLNIQWDNYILIDNLASDAFSTWAGGPPVGQPETLADPSLLIKVEGEAVRQVCAKFSTQSQGQRDSFNWEQVVPDHLLTDIPLDFGLLSLNRLNKTGQAIQCDIYSE